MGVPESAGVDVAVGRVTTTGGAVGWEVKGVGVAGGGVGRGVSKLAGFNETVGTGVGAGGRTGEQAASSQTKHSANKTPRNTGGLKRTRTSGLIHVKDAL